METLESIPRVVQNWRLLTTPPCSGEENMRYDADLLNGVEQGTEPPTLRFFRFKNPALSYGHLQKFSEIASLIPPGWESVQRPTGGGVVLHQNDLCLALCWPRGISPLPKRAQEQYQWIHRVIWTALGSTYRMAACCDVRPSRIPFGIRTCFTEPVGYDLLQNDQKVVGGALACRRGATLYQGSIQTDTIPDLEARLHAVFEARLTG